VPDLHADTLAPLVILLLFLVVLGLTLWVLYRKHLRSPVNMPGYKRHIIFVSGLLAIAVIGCSWAAIHTERDLDKRDAAIAARLSRSGVELLAVDGNNNRVKVRSGDCTAWFKIKDGTFWNGKGWPLTGAAIDQAGDCTGREFMPR